MLAIGKASEMGLRGLSGIESNEWYRDIILGDLEFSADDLLEFAYPKLARQNSGKMPANKHLANAIKEFPEIKELMKKQDFDSIISRSIKDGRKYLGSYTSVKQIWDKEKVNVLQNESRAGTNIRRLIRIYDYLKWGK